VICIGIFFSFCTSWLSMTRNSEVLAAIIAIA
jgi:hypothetical protein